MKSLLFKFLCMVCTGVVTPVFAGTTVTLTFDDLPAPATYGSAVPAGYGGLQWNNFNYLDGAGFVASGYQNGVVSSGNVAFNGTGNPAQISSGTAFDLNSAWLTAAWNDGLQLEVQGFAGGTLAYDQTYTLNATASTLLTFSYLAVDQVNFISSGGVNHGYDGSGTQFVMDNVTVTVPEPNSTMLLLFGSALIVLQLRKR